jgi:hypothetical protein
VAYCGALADTVSPLEEYPPAYDDAPYPDQP